MKQAERLRALLGRGYFPRELPPPFTTKNFAAQAAAVARQWAAHVSGLKPNERERLPRASVPVVFDMARRAHSRRVLSIPNPVNQYYLAEAICANWGAIQALTSSSPYSITKADISVTGVRAVPLPPFSDLPEHRVRHYAAHRFVLQVDVESFYHALYTHAVPWALHGKEQAKANRRRGDPAFFGNDIDFLARQCQDGQTKGIPVGPDTSRIISECVLAAADKIIQDRCGGRILSGFRYIDDMFFCFDSQEGMRAAHAEVRAALRHFDPRRPPRSRPDAAWP
jgi:hypothetical protein